MILVKPDWAWAEARLVANNNAISIGRGVMGFLWFGVVAKKQSQWNSGAVATSHHCIARHTFATRAGVAVRCPRWESPWALAFDSAGNSIRQDRDDGDDDEEFDEGETTKAV